MAHPLTRHHRGPAQPVDQICRLPARQPCEIDAVALLDQLPDIPSLPLAQRAQVIQLLLRGERPLRPGPGWDHGAATILVTIPATVTGFVTPVARTRIVVGLHGAASLPALPKLLVEGLAREGEQFPDAIT